MSHSYWQRGSQLASYTAALPYRWFVATNPTTELRFLGVTHGPDHRFTRDGNPTQPRRCSSIRRPLGVVSDTPCSARRIPATPSPR